MIFNSKDLPFFVSIPVFLWQFFFFYLPIFLIFFLSLSLENYQYFFQDFTYIFIILKSLLLALINVSLCFIIGYPVAYFLVFKAHKYKNIFLYLLILPFWTNFLLHIYAWFFIISKVSLNLLYSKFAITIVMLYCYLPFMILPIYSALSGLDKRLIEISLDLGAGIFYTWRKIMIPLTMSGIRAGCFLVLVPSFTEFVIPSLMGGDKYVIVGSVISDYILGNQTMSYGTAFTCISGVAFILFLLIFYFIGTKKC